MQKTKLKNIPRALIRKSSLHWGRTITDEDVADLGESIDRVGLIHPITVRKNGKMYEYLAGERRFRALAKKGVKDVPCIVVSLDDLSSEMLSIEENLKIKRPNSAEWDEGVQRHAILCRKQLNKESMRKSDKPDPERVGKGRPKEVENQVVDAVADKLNVSKRSVERALDRGKLIPAAARAFANGKITQKQADLLAHMSPDEQINNLPKISKEKEKQTSTRVAVEKVRDSTDDKAGVRATVKVFNSILARCKELHELSEEFRKEITDERVGALLHINRDYLIHCHRSLTNLLDDIESVEGWRKSTDGD